MTLPSCLTTRSQATLGPASVYVEVVAVITRGAMRTIPFSKNRSWVLREDVRKLTDCGLASVTILREANTVPQE